MATSAWATLISKLEKNGISFASGLTDAEIASSEESFGFIFPPDLREFLQTALPIGRHFPNWRSGYKAEIKDRLRRPLEGILFDIENNSFWLDEWGARPANLTEAKETATQLVAAAPVLIPIYMHRMMPAEPCQPGNPVFSVHQTDIIVYGIDLQDYLHHEFLMSEEQQEEWTVPPQSRPIRFWDTERFQEVRWGDDGGCVFDNSRVLPVSVPELVWRMVYAGDLRFSGGRAWVARSVGNCRRS